MTSLVFSYAKTQEVEGSTRRWRDEDKKTKPLMRSVCTACSHAFLLSLSSHQLLPVVVPFVGVASMTPGQNCKNASGNSEGESERNKTEGVDLTQVHENNNNNTKKTSFYHFTGSLCTNLVLRSVKHKTSS